MKEFLGLPLDASAHGTQIDQIIVITHWLMLFLFVGWGAFFIYTLVRFRKSRQQQADHVGVRSHASSYLEVAVAVFEGALLIGFAIPVWSNVVSAFPSEQDALVVHVVAEQFAWNVHYPGADGIFGKRDMNLISEDNPLGLDRSDPVAEDDIATINQLNLPVNKNILIYLTSKDVIHSFGIPLLRVKQDVIPGQTIRVWFRPTMTNDQIRESMAKRYTISRGQIPEGLVLSVAMDGYQASDGSLILEKGDYVTEDVIEQLIAEGISEVYAAPDTPMEIACAQLCGLGHYRMRGTVTIQTAEEFEEWLAEEAEYLEW